MIRYLLDELYTYEQDHSDALNPNNTHDVNRYQLGGHPTHAFEGFKDELKDELKREIMEGVGECRELFRQVLGIVSESENHNLNVPGTSPHMPLTSSLSTSIVVGCQFFRL